jgi:hypothetical protein
MVKEGRKNEIKASIWHLFECTTYCIFHVSLYTTTVCKDVKYYHSKLPDRAVSIFYILYLDCLVYYGEL